MLKLPASTWWSERPAPRQPGARRDRWCTTWVRGEELHGDEGQAGRCRLTPVTDNAATKQIMVDFPEKVRLELTEDATLKVLSSCTTSISPHPTREAPRLVCQDLWSQGNGARSVSGRYDSGSRSRHAQGGRGSRAYQGRSLDHIGFEVKGWRNSARNFRRMVLRSTWRIARCRS